MKSPERIAAKNEETIDEARMSSILEEREKITLSVFNSDKTRSKCSETLASSQRFDARHRCLTTRAKIWLKRGDELVCFYVCLFEIERIKKNSICLIIIK